jgi:hypothetical protein
MNQDPTSALQIHNSKDMDLLVAYFGGLVDLATKMAQVNDGKPGFKARPSASISNCIHCI